MGAIPSGRSACAFQKTFDDVWMRDDKEFYFGTDGDVAFRYDSSNGVLDIEGADLRLSDTVKLEFGDAGDASITHDGTDTKLTGDWHFQGGDVRLSDTVKLMLGAQSTIYLSASEDASGESDGIKFTGIATSDTGVSGVFYLGADGSDVCITP